MTSIRKTIQGKIEEVGLYPISAEMLETAPIGATELLVDNVYEFIEEGGLLLVDDYYDPDNPPDPLPEPRVLVYTGFDEDAGTLLLSVALLEEIPEDTVIFQEPVAEEKLATVRMDEGEDSVMCRIPHHMQSTFPDGVRQPGQQETVLVAIDDDDEFYVVEQIVQGLRYNLADIGGGDLGDSLEEIMKELDVDLTELNTVTLPGLRLDLDAANADINTLNAVTLPALQTDIDAANADISTLNTVTLPALQSDLDANASAINTLNVTTLPALQSDLDAANSAISTLNVTTIPGLQSDIDGNAAALNTINVTTLPGLQNDIDDNASALNTLNVITLPALQSDVDAANNNIATLNNTTLPGLQSDLTALENEVAAIESFTSSDWFPVIETNIADGAISTPKITVNSLNGDRVTANTLQASKIVAGSISTDRFTANTISGSIVTAGTLNADKITANSITTDRFTSNTISGTIITAGTLNADKIVANSITTDRFTSNSISGSIITAGTLAADKIVANSIQTAQITSNSINGDRITALTLAADKIVANSITTSQITASGINGDRITANTLDAGRIIAGSIQTDRMTSNTISGSVIAAGTLNADKITANSITTNRFTSNTISGTIITANTLNADKIVANSITSDKFTANTINGNIITTNTLNADKIIANTLQAAIVNAGAVNGITITGSQVQTALSASRVVMRNAANPGEGGATWGLLEFYNDYAWNPGRLWGSGDGTNGQLRISSPYSGSDWLTAASITMTSTTAGDRIMNLYAKSMEFTANQYNFTSWNGSSVDFKIKNAGGKIAFIDGEPGVGLGRIRFEIFAGKNFSNLIYSANQSNGRTGLSFSCTEALFETSGNSSADVLRFKNADNDNTVPQIGTTNNFPSISFSGGEVRISTWSSSTNAGDLQPIRASVYRSPSDIRSKSNVRKVTGALDVLRKVPAYDYDTPGGSPKKRSELVELQKPENAHLWETTVFEQRGVMAHELQRFLPEAVYEDDIEEGSQLAVDLYYIATTVWAAARDLAEENESLREDLADLRKMVETLSKKSR